MIGKKSYNILIVEDDDADLTLLRKQLEKIWPSCNTLTVKSLAETYIAYKENNIDLVLLDLNLPDAYGANTVQEVRRFNKIAPVIVITSLETNMTVYNALKLGANNVVLKSQLTDPDFVNILEQNIA